MKRAIATVATVALLLAGCGLRAVEEAPRPDPGCAADDIAEAAPLC